MWRCCVSSPPTANARAGTAAPQRGLVTQAQVWLGWEVQGAGKREAKDSAATGFGVRLTGSLVAPEEPTRREKPQDSQALGPEVWVSTGSGLCCPESLLSGKLCLFTLLASPIRTGP